MPRVEKSAIVRRAPDVVWSFLTERENAPLYVPGLVRVWDVRPKAPGVGRTWRFEYKLLELPLEGTARMAAFESGRSFEFVTETALKSHWTYELSPSGSDTRVQVILDYALPDSLPFSRTVEQVRDARMSELLRNLAARLEC